MKEQPPPDAKCRDKFLVQSVAVTADKEFTNIGAIVRYIRLEVEDLLTGYSGNTLMMPRDRLSKRRRSVLCT